LITSVEAGSEVTIWLRSGGHVTGLLASDADGDAPLGVGVVQLSRATVAREALEPGVDEKVVLVRAEDVELIAFTSPEADVPAAEVKPDTRPTRFLPPRS
jgi:hypothetical protein